MASTTFVNGTTLTDAGWFNDVNDAIYQETPLGYGGTAGGTADALTLSPSPAISAYVTGNQFTFKAASANTGAATVAVSGLAAKAIQNNGSALTAGQIEAGKWYVIVYDGTAFQLTKVAITSFTGGTLTSDLTMSGASIIEAEGAAVASASSCNIWATDGNTVHITGTTTINDFATAPQAGAWMKVIFDGALTLTQSANLNLNGGGSNITTAADDMAFVYADTTTQMDVFVVRKSGAAVVASTGLPMDSIYGCTLSNNTGDATNDIDITAGSRRDTLDAENMVLASALTKQLDAAWAVGTNAGGRDTGSIANGTWHWHLIKRTDTGVVDAIASLSPDARATVTMTIASPCVVTWVDHGLQNGASISFTTTGALPTGLTASTTYFVVSRAADTFQVAATQGGAAINTSGTQSGTHTCRAHPVMPTNYTVNRGIGATLREAAALVAFVQDGNDFMRKTAVLDINATNPGTSAVSRTLSVPTGLRCKVIVNAAYKPGATNNASLYLSDLLLTDSAASSSAAPLSTVGGANLAATNGNIAFCWSNRNAAIRSRQDDADTGTVVRIATLGWFDQLLPRLT